MIVKICGITNVEDALAAEEAGAEAIGLNFWRPGQRYVEPERAAEIAARVGVKKVGVFVDEELGTVLKILGFVGLDAVQLHGAETPGYLKQLGETEMWKAFKMDSAWRAARLAGYERAAAYLLDAPGLTPGGTGQAFDWTRALAAKPYGRVILAGGLNPGNVADAVRCVRPWGVDVASGVEQAPGRKDHAKIRAFVHAARQAAEEPA